MTYKISKITSHIIPKKEKVIPAEKVFITKNRIEMSMVDMGEHLGIPYSRVRTFMVTNNLMLSKPQVQKLRDKKGFNLEKSPKVESYKQPRYVPDPWNHNLNLITMIK